jgi:capsular polysaccharide biosynthesis protein
MSAQSARSRREVRISVLAGAVVALLVVVAGAWLALTTPTKWTAESALVVLPGADLNASDSAAYYETLSRGQIVATFAEVADNLRFQQQAEQTLQLSDAQRADVTTTVSVVPDTSVILVRTTAGTAAIAEQMADATTTLASKYLAGLSKPYRTELVHSAQGSAFSSGTSPTTLLVIALVVALVAGVAIQQAVYHLLVAMRTSKRSREPAVFDDVGGAGQAPVPERTAGTHGS